MDQDGCSECGEKWQNFGCVLKIELIRFVKNKLKGWIGYKKYFFKSIKKLI